MSTEESRKPGMIVGTIKLRHHLTHKRILWALVVFIVAIVLIIVAIIATRARNKTSSQQTKEAKDYAILMENVHKYRDLSENDLAKSVLLEFDKKYSSQETPIQKYSIASQLSAIYLTLNDNKNAVLWQTKAVESKPNPSFNDYNVLGEAYLRLGDKPNAIKYLKLALAELNKDKRYTQDSPNKAYLIGEIAELEGK